MGENTVSGLMPADNFVGISETPEGLQKQLTKEGAKTHYDTLRNGTANVKECAV